jgi:hypothetical protein
MRSRFSSPEFSPLAIGQDLAPLPTYKPASTTTITFSHLLSSPLQLHEDLSSGCGGQLWPAGMVLAKQMLRYHGEGLRGARMFVDPFFSFADMLRHLLILKEVVTDLCGIKIVLSLELVLGWWGWL